jgi:hypothetical protein
MIDFAMDLPFDQLADVDSDGIADAHDFAIDSDGDSIEDSRDGFVDSDGDWAEDSTDPLVDRDVDWTDDRQDIMVDGDYDLVKDAVLSHLPDDPFLAMNIGSDGPTDVAPLVQTVVSSVAFP